MSLHVEYSAFGEIFAKEQVGSFSSVYLYQSKSFDEETGYIFYGSRYYDPSLSLWLSVADAFGDEYPNERAGGYLNTAGLMNNAQGNSALVTAGGAGGSSAMLGSSAGGAPLSAYETGDDGGGGGDGKGDRPNKGGNKSAGSKGNVGKGNHGAYSGAKEAGSNNPHKRGFRQGRNGLKAGGMFYSHNKQQKSKGNKISQIKQPVKTRPRR
jgi:RHS repeat-associated protein